MASNVAYGGASELPDVLAVFPLPGALLLPRGQMPLNVFEPRYLAMVDDAFRLGTRVIGMIQPTPEDEDSKKPRLAAIGCAGRITQLAETGDGRYVISLTGVARFRVIEELATTTPYRQCRVDFSPFADDFEPRRGEEAVDRTLLLSTLKEFLEANSMEADWDGIQRAPTEALVNALCMMSPWGVPEKQALLEAPDLRTRAALLVAVTEVALAKDKPHTDKPTLN